MTSTSDYLQFEHATRESHPDLFSEAVRIRNLHWGRVVTYSRKVFVPLTTMCRDECGYCVFVKRPGHPDARYMTPDEVMGTVRAGLAVGCKEVLFSLGEKPERRYEEARAALASLGYRETTDYLRDLCERVLLETGMLPHVNAGTLDEAELKSLRRVSASMGMMMENVSRRLTRQGGAHYRCPDKVPVQRLRALERAGRARVPFTTGILIGIGETWQERLDTLVAINESNRAHGHIQEVIVQNFRAKQGIPMSAHPEPDHDDMMRTLAVARLILHPAISLQAPPNLEERYEDYVEAGLNDWGGVSPVTVDYINPERAWPQITELEHRSRSLEMNLRERLTVYPRFIADPEAWLEPTLRPHVDALAGAGGLAAVQCMN